MEGSFYFVFTCGQLKSFPSHRYLLSVGGDGCIFSWKLAESLVKAMQDRLMELYASAQRRSIRISAPPPPPSPPIVASLSANTAASLAVKQYHHQVGGRSNQSNIIQEQSSGEGSPRPTSGNKWVSRVDSDKGYELFGRQILPSKEKHKLTLELTSDVTATPLRAKL